MEKKHYVYRHTKLGTSEVFYIGIGSSAGYFRAHTPHGRSKWWNRVIEKYGYEVEILATNLNREEACDIEIILIDWYKRKDCCGGTLVNLTDGGEGTLGLVKTACQIEKWKASNKGKQDGALNVMFGKTRGLHHLAKEVIDLSTGIFYDCGLDACIAGGFKYSTFKSKLNGSLLNDTYYIYADNYRANYTPDNFKQPIGNIKVINKITGEIFDSIKAAAKSIGMKAQNLAYKLNYSNDTNFSLLHHYEAGISIEKKRGWKKYILDTSTGIYYDGLKDVCESLNLKLTTVKNWLSNASKTSNPSSLIYV